MAGHPFVRSHCDGGVLPGAAPVTVTFVKKGVEVACRGLAGENLVHLAHANGVELEGACECSLACSTCHVILQPAAFDALPAAGEEEEDLLDLAFGLTPTCVPSQPPLPAASPFAHRAGPLTPAPPASSFPLALRKTLHAPGRSRLGCQVKLSAALDGQRVQLPSATRNMYVDGHVPKPH